MILNHSSKWLNTSSGDGNEESFSCYPLVTRWFLVVTRWILLPRWNLRSYMMEESCVIVTCSWCFLLEIVVIIGNSCLLLFLIIVSVFISSLIHHIFVMIYPKYNWCIYRPYTYDILCVHWLQMVVLGYFFTVFHRSTHR